MTVGELRAEPFRVSLPRPWGSEVTDLGLVAVTVRTEDGVGHGFSWTPSRGLSAVTAMLNDDIADWVRGRPVDLVEWRAEGWQALWEHLHEAGGGGITTIAMAGLDLALWDLAARRSGGDATDLLGRRRDRVAVYGSGVNLHLSTADLRAQAERWVAAGHHTVKMKVGRPRLADDLERVAAVREILGPDRTLLVDANQRWDLDRASTAVVALAEHGIGWIEEPLRADDLTGHVELHRRLSGLGVPIAAGENLYTVQRFGEFIDAGALDVVQPNVIRTGGLTGAWRIVELAERTGTELKPHLLPELSAVLALCTPTETAIEDVEDAGLTSLGVLAGPAPVRIDRLWAEHQPGRGLGLALTPPSS